MAEDKKKNEDPEEEKKNIFDDDEDFGLPDLDYDELDEDEDEDDDSEETSELEEDSDSAFGDASPEIESESAFGNSPSEVEEVQDLSDIELTEEEMQTTDEQEDWEKELEKELETEMESDEDSNAFYEEESYDEFDTTPKGSAPAVVEESAFGGEEIVDDSTEEGEGAMAFEESEAESTDYASDAVAATAATTAYASAEDRDENKGKFVRTVVIGTIFIVAIAFILIFIYRTTGGDSEGKELAKVEKPVTKKPAVTKPTEEVKPKAEVKPKPQPKVKPQPKALPSGEVTKLEQPTGKAYIVVASFFDDDLATDYAKELSAKGNGSIVIPPFRDSRFYRVAVASFDNFKDANDGLADYTAEFGDGIWPLRY